jgi:hypothetical protein
LKNAESSSDHMSYKFGMNVSEILQGLNNLLANDENKEKLMSYNFSSIPSSLNYVDKYYEGFQEKL